MSSVRLMLAIVVPALLCAGCAGPKPWEKGDLARPEMAMGGDPLDKHFSEHIYGSKQAASGGYGVGGGGCGCN